MSFTEERRARIRHVRERYRVRRDIDLHPHPTHLIYTEWQTKDMAMQNEETETKPEHKCPFCGSGEEPEENESGWPACPECKGV